MQRTAIWAILLALTVLRLPALFAFPRLWAEEGSVYLAHALNHGPVEAITTAHLGLTEGDRLPRSIVEFYYKDDDLQDPLVAEEHVTAFNWASTQDMDDMIAMALRVNDFLSGMFAAVGIRLVDFKLEFGRVFDQNEIPRVILADEISPDSCRLWDIHTNEKLDKDRFRRDLGNVTEAYAEVARRLGIMKENGQVITEEEGSQE